MKFFFLSIILFCNFLSAYSQQDHFVYLQAENKQPFYVKLDNKQINSNPSGYLILSKINDGIHGLVIGFSNNEGVEQEFNLSVNKKDLGFLIRNTAENNWQLVNLQTLNVINPGNVIVRENNTSPQQVVMLTDPFSVLLARVVKDSTILEKDEVAPTFAVADTGLVAPPEKKITPKKITPKKVVASAKRGVKHKTKIKIVKPALPDSTVSARDSSSIANALAKENISDTARTLPLKKVVASAKPGVKHKTKIKIVKPAVPDSAVSARDSVSIANALAKQTVSDTAQTVAPKKVVASAKPGVKHKTKIKVIKPAVPDSTVSARDSVSIANALAKQTVSDTAQTLAPKKVVAAAKRGVKQKIKIKTVKPVPDSTVQNDVVTSQHPIEQKEIPVKKDTPVVAAIVSDHSNGETKVFSQITRILKKKNKEGTELVYIDDSGDIKDTIRIFIPAEKAAKKKEEPQVVISETDKQNDLKENPGIENKQPATPVVTSKMINSDCKNIATDDDFFKTRKKMVAENNDEGMLKAAKKIFKTKCFTTEQIKNLSTLFLTDAGKFNFFEAAYAFASDSDQYYLLQNQLSDPLYIDQFKAMIHK